MAKPNQQQVADKYDQSTKLSTFPPYWQAEVGASLEVQVLGVDSRDPEFMRYVFLCAQEKPIECSTGPKNDAKSVQVHKGEEFTCSYYKGLEGLIDYAECGTIRIRCTGTRDVNQPKPMYVFEVDTTPEVRKLLAEKKNALSVRSQAPGTSFPHGANAAE